MMIRFFLVLVSAVFLNGCYHVDLQQGNIINKNMITKLQIGMSKSQVDSVLGLPILNNIFDKDTWNYVYTKQTGGKKLEKKTLILEFKDNKLIKIKTNDLHNN